MGLSLSAATAIICVSLFLAIEITMGSVFPTISDINDSYSQLKDRAIEQVQSDISIIKIVNTTNNSNYDLNITVNNTGSTALKTSGFNILINGTDKNFVASDTYIYPEEQVYFNLYNLPGNGKQRLKVVTNNGISDYDEYTI